MASIDEKQREIVDCLSEWICEAAPGRSAIWNVTGAVGSGKTTILYRLRDQLRAEGLKPILLVVPEGEQDVGAIAISELADQLKGWGLMNGDAAILTDPRRPWDDKLGAIGSAIRRREEEIVLVCDEPTHWYRRDPAQVADTSESRIRGLAEWIAKYAECRRVISGWIPGGARSQQWVVAPRLEDGNEYLADISWEEGRTSALAETVRGRMSPDAGAQPPWTMRLLVVIARFSPDLDVTPDLLATGAPGLLETLLSLVQQDPLHATWEAVLGRLAVARTPISRGTFDRFTADLDALDRDLVRLCLCEQRDKGVVLHPLLRHKLWNRDHYPLGRDEEAHWLLPRDARQAVHHQLITEYTEARKGSFRHSQESLLHEVLGGAYVLCPDDDRLYFVEQLHEIGRTMSYVLRDRQAAVGLFRLALDLDPNSAYSHHYLAFNLDWLAEKADEIEVHYQKAIELQRSHPWWWSRWISYLATRGRFKAARETWRRAADTLSVGDDESSDWVYLSLHRWVARWLLHWGELDFAAEVLRSIPERLREENASVQALQDLLSALRIAEYEPAVFPLTVPYSRWWARPNGHTGLPIDLDGRSLRTWMPARVEAIDSGKGKLVLTAMKHPDETGGAREYFTVVLSRRDVASAANGFSWDDLGEGRLVELGYYGDKRLLRIGLHREIELRGPNILPLVPPPDRWYRRAVEESWESMKGSD